MSSIGPVAPRVDRRMLQSSSANRKESFREGSQPPVAHRSPRAAGPSNSPEVDRKGAGKKRSRDSLETEGSGSEEPSQQKSRSSLACRLCREVKTRCVSTGSGTCERCKANGTDCIFPPSRRGRKRGSKNLKTLERESQAGLLRAYRERSSAQPSFPALPAPWSDSACAGCVPSLGITQHTQSYCRAGCSSNAETSGFLDVTQSDASSAANSDALPISVHQQTEFDPSIRKPFSEHEHLPSMSTIPTPGEPAVHSTSLADEPAVHAGQLSRRLYTMIGKQFPVVEDQDGEEEEDGSKEDSVSGSPTDPPLTSIVRIAEREWEVRDQEDSDDPQGDSTGQGESSERFRPAQHNEQGVAGRTDSSYPHRGVEGEDPRSRIPGAKGKEFPVADTIGSSCTGRKSAHTKGSRRSKGKLSIPPDGIDLSEGELEKLQRWSSGALEEVMRFQRRYFKTRLYGSKRDVADRLDPIQSKMVNESRALELMDAYWNHVYPQWAMLDPELHKLAFIRQRSALLTTTLLALGATALSTLPYHTEADVLEAFHLHQHVEKLNVLVFTTGARSIEIVQAHVLLCRFGVAPRTILEEQRWMRAAMIPRMATEIGLHLPKRWKRRRDQQETVQQRELRERMRLNELRTRAFMVINEYRFHVHSGRKLMDLSPLELTSEEIQEITKLGPYHHAVSLPAFYEQYLFGRDVKKRLDTSAESAANDLSLDAELTWIDTYTERWLQDWCPTDGPVKSRWHLVHDALSHQLLLMVNVARRRKTAPLAHAKPDQATKGKAVPGRTSSTSDQERQQQQQQKLLQLAERIFTEALTTPTTTHMTHRASILPFVATIILRLNGRCELILRVALNMAGAPGQRYVPTFVREAGHQMLAMLCVNDARPITSASPQSPQSSRAEKERVLQENPANGNSWPRPPTPLSSNLENIGPAYPEHRGDASAHSAQTTTFYLPVDQRAPELTQGRSPQHDAADGQSGFQFDFASQFPLFPFFSDGSFEFPYTPDSAQWALPASGPTTTFDFLGSELAPSGSSGSDQNFAFQMPSDLDVLLGTMSNGDNGNDLLANNLCVRGEGGTDLFSSTWPGLPQGSNKSDASPWSDHPAASASGPPSTQQVPTMPLPDTAAHNTGFHNDLGMLNAVDTMAHSPQATFNPSWLVDALRLANSNANTTSGSARGDGNSSQGNYRQVLTDAAVQLIQLASSVQ